MLKFKTKIGPSKISGIGLFADEFIPKDSIIWEYNSSCDRVYTQEEYDSVEPILKAFLQKYCFRFNNKYYLCVDDARFFNHSGKPNCYSSDFENGIGYTRALVDIKEGEELTDNYLEFGSNEDDNSWNNFMNRTKK